MTWTKTGVEFSDELANLGVSDAAYRTHHEAIQWLYRVERDDCRIPRHLVRRFAGSNDYEQAIKELVNAGLWDDAGDHYVIHHHAGVVRQSIGFQRASREGSRERSRRYRERKRVTRDATGDTDSQTDSTKGEHSTRDQEWP